MKKESASSNVVNIIGILLIVVSYVGAIVNIITTQRDQEPPGKKVIRICHWQLEAGFREAMDWVISEFEKKHPDIKVIQLAVYDRAYRQFMTTQLIGRTAPDIIEQGRLTGADKPNDIGRFFLSLTEDVYEPNEYNANNEFRETPWISTFSHNLEWNWDEQTQEYYTVGITALPSRMVYNKTLMSKIWKKDTLPSNFREFIELCEETEAYSKETGKKVFPVAASRYEARNIGSSFLKCLTANYPLDYIERDYDYKDQGGEEKALSWLEGRYDFDDKEIHMGVNLIVDIMRFFEPGFMAKGRQESMFSFIQQQALMINTGAWAMYSLVQQAKENGFEIGVLSETLYPSKDDPVYGPYVDGREAESRNNFNMPFGICRFTKYPDAALKFLKFYSSKEIAEEFCKRSGWICAIKNTKNAEHMKGFEPNYTGYPGGRNVFCVGDNTDVLFYQLTWELFEGKVTPADFIHQYTKKFIPVMAKDLRNQMFAREGTIHSITHNLSGLSFLLHTPEGAQHAKNLKRKLSYAYDSFVYNYLRQQGTVYELRNISDKGLQRFTALSEIGEYKEIMDNFQSDFSQ